jgi:hypothetical protein
MIRRLGTLLLTLSTGATLFTALPSASDAHEVLVADRLTDRILRYSASGSFLGVLLEDSTNLDEPNGMALSPDGTQLYVASRQNNSVVRYDYDGASATNPEVVISSGISVPASLLFSQDGTKLYVSNLGVAFDGATVAQFNLDGTSAGPDLTGGEATGRTGLAFGPDGALLVGTIGDQTTFESKILRYSEANQQFETFIGPTQALMGGGNIVVDGNGVYAAAGFAGGVFKFDYATAQFAQDFAPITGLEFPASLSLAPDGNSLLVGILGFADGAGRIDRYSLQGALIETFANNSNENPELGFREATGLLVVPGVDAPQVGDTNGDGLVDIVDLNNVRNNFGATGAPDGTLAGDAYPFDGAVDIEDLNGVRNNFGTEPEPVPEPAAVTLAFIAVAALGMMKRRCK